MIIIEDVNQNKLSFNNWSFKKFDQSCSNISIQVSLQSHIQYKKNEPGISVTN